MKLIRQSTATGLALAAMVVAACSTGPKQTASSGGNTGPGTPPGVDDSSGALSMQLTLQGGEHFSSVKYTLSNQAWSGASPTATAAASPDTLTGNYNISGTTNLSFVIGTVPAGTGYALEVTTTSDDGLVTCSYPSNGIVLPSGGQGLGPQNITIVNRTTTVDSINLQCVNNQGLDAGSLLVNAVESNCPVWNTIVANPLNITLDAGQNVNSAGSAGSNAFFDAGVPVPAMITDGQQLVLVGAATGPNPGALAFNWSVPAGQGTISSATGTNDPNSTDAGTTNQTIYTCPTTGAGTYNITLTVTDGPVPDGGSCDSRYATGVVQVTCNSLVPCAAFSGDVASPNSATGSCAAFPDTVNAGTPDNTGSFCCTPPPACPTGPFANPFPGGTCTAPLVNNGAGCCVGLQPCTTAGQTNCVPCSGNSSGLCSPTEAILVSLDIAKGNATTPTAETALTQCYFCAFQKSCINDTVFPDTGHECGDLGSGNFVSDGGPQGPESTICLATLQCMVNTGCAQTNGGADNCYCGAGGGAPTPCKSAGAATNGACKSQEIDGFTFGPNDSLNIVNNFTAASQPSGVANQIIVCAAGNGCNSCLL